MSYSTRTAQCVDTLGDYQPAPGGTVYPQGATDGAGARARTWVARVGVGEWPRPCVCAQEVADLTAALAGVDDSHAAWRV